MKRGGAAEIVGSQLQDRLARWLRPEFLGPLHATVDLFFLGRDKIFASRPVEYPQLASPDAEFIG